MRLSKVRAVFVFGARRPHVLPTVVLRTPCSSTSAKSVSAFSGASLAARLAALGPPAG